MPATLIESLKQLCFHNYRVVCHMLWKTDIAPQRSLDYRPSAEKRAILGWFGHWVIGPPATIVQQWKIQYNSTWVMSEKNENVIPYVHFFNGLPAWTPFKIRPWWGYAIHFQANPQIEPTNSAINHDGKPVCSGSRLTWSVLSMAAKTRSASFLAGKLRPTNYLNHGLTEYENKCGEDVFSSHQIWSGVISFKANPWVHGLGFIHSECDGLCSCSAAVSWDTASGRSPSFARS